MIVVLVYFNQFKKGRKRFLLPLTLIKLILLIF